MKSLLLLASLLSFLSLVHARTWTDVRGRKIEAELVSQDETNVVLQKPGGTKPVSVPLASLSEADHEFLRAEAAKANAPIAASGKYAAQWSGSFEQGNFGGNLPFLLRVPKDLKTGGKVPLLLFLHGAGEKGDDNKKQLKHDPTKLAPKDVFEKNPMIVVAPQCPADQFWSGEPLESVIKLVKDLQKELPVDSDRIYITGLSMGGYGTWGALAMEPRLFAAAVPICGGGDPGAVKKFDKVPIWAFHNDGDPTVGVEGSRSMIAALKKAGAEPKYTEYPSPQHDAWTRTYKDPALWEWLLTQKRKQ
jgi:predicted peptidase